VLYELATSQRPFPETFGPLLIDSILHQNPPSILELNPQISPGIDSVIRKALQKEPDRRYGSAQEMRDDLERVRRHAPADVTRARTDVPSQAPPMEIAHVLFTDIVGYSKLAMDAQQRNLRQLQKLVRSTAEFERAKANDQLISLPTGDGMALVFFGEPEAPARCAFELSKSLRANPEIQLRMGVNSGPVYRVADINANRNVAGGGINIAQRVMDCGDAGHILVSKAVAEVLGQLSAWRGYLHDLGDVEVKHGVLVHIYNLYAPDAGNPAVPDKLSRVRDQAKAPSASRQTRYTAGFAALLVLALAVVAFIVLRGKPNPTPPAAPFAKPRVAIAVMGFQNISAHPEEDWISTSLSEELTTELAVSQKLRTVSGEEVSAARSDLGSSKLSSFGKATLAKLRKDLASDYVISGAYLATGSQSADSLRVDFRLQNTETGEIADAMQLSGTIGGLPELAEQTGLKLLSKLGLGASADERSQAGSSPLPANPAAARFYAQGLDKLRKFDPLGARDLFQRAIAAEPNLAVAHSALAEAWSALGYDKDASLEAKKAFELSVTLPVESRRSIEGRYYRLSSQWDEAAKTYRSLSGVYQDEPAYALDLADVQTRAGKGVDALSTLKELKKNPRWKDDPRIDLAEAYAASALSDVAAQQRAATSAAQKASQNGSKFLAAQAYWLECGARFALGQPQPAEAACRQSMQASTSAPVYMARSQTVLASILESEGKTSEAMELRLGALRTARDIHSNQDIIGALMNLANLLASQGRTDEARKNYEEAFGVAKEIGDKQHLMDLQSEMATNLAAQGRIDEAKQGYELSLKTAQEIGDVSGIAGAYQNISLLLLQMGELSQAEVAVQHSLEVSRKAELTSAQASGKSLLGDVLLTQGKLAEAQKSNEGALKIYSDLKQPAGIADCQVSLANVAIENNRPNEAERLARLAASEYQEEKLVSQEAEARNTLARALLLQGKLREAKDELDAADTLAVPEQSTRLSLDITRARFNAGSGKVANASAVLEKALREATRLHLYGKELEIRLARLEVSKLESQRLDLASLQELESEARNKGYVMIAQRAANLRK
jgi:class 3 adenylate cyclase/tetratricopeptide (TPR) repeat protein